MTKKRLAILLTALFSIAAFIGLAIYLPYEIVEEEASRGASFFVKIAFVSLGMGGAAGVLGFSAWHRGFVLPYAQTARRYIPLLRQLVKRDFITRYKRSALGVLWSLLSPLLTMIVMTLVFSYVFRFDIPNFPVYLLGGQIVFNFFSEATSTAMSSVINGAPMIKKVYIPKYIFPVSRVLTGMVNLLFAFLAYLLVYLFTGAPWSPTFFLFPVPLLYTLVFSLGTGLFLSSVAVFFRDTMYLYAVLVTTLSFFTPLFYPVSILPETMKYVIGFNPLYHFVNYFRAVTLYGTVPGLWENAVCASFAILALLLGVFVFFSQQDDYILHL